MGFGPLYSLDHCRDPLCGAGVEILLSPQLCLLIAGRAISRTGLVTFVLFYAPRRVWSLGDSQTCLWLEIHASDVLHSTHKIITLFLTYEVRSCDLGPPAQTDLCLGWVSHSTYTLSHIPNIHSFSLPLTSVYQQGRVVPLGNVPYLLVPPVCLSSVLAVWCSIYCPLI